MFSQTSEYALRAVAYLVEQSPSARTTAEIAKATRVPSPYLSKVLQALRGEGILSSRRGIGGGISLNRPPDELTILDVINAVDPICRIHECPLGLAAHGTQLCPLHSRLDNAMALVEQAFGETTLAEMLDEPRGRRAQCNFPNVGKS